MSTVAFFPLFIGGFLYIGYASCCVYAGDKQNYLKHQLGCAFQAWSVHVLGQPSAIQRSVFHKAGDSSGGQQRHHRPSASQSQQAHKRLAAQSSKHDFIFETHKGFLIRLYFREDKYIHSVWIISKSVSHAGVMLIHISGLSHLLVGKQI